MYRLRDLKNHLIVAGYLNADITIQVDNYKVFDIDEHIGHLEMKTEYQGALLCDNIHESREVIPFCYELKKWFNAKGKVGESLDPAFTSTATAEMMLATVTINLMDEVNFIEITDPEDPTPANERILFGAVEYKMLEIPNAKGI